MMRPEGARLWLHSRRRIDNQVVGGFSREAAASPSLIAPLQGAVSGGDLPRALPWATIGPAFQACGRDCPGARPQNRQCHLVPRPEGSVLRKPRAQPWVGEAWSMRPFRAVPAGNSPRALAWATIDGPFRPLEDVAVSETRDVHYGQAGHNLCLYSLLPSR